MSKSPPKALLKFRRVTIRGAQPPERLSEEICLSEGSSGVSPGFCGVSPGFCGGPQDFRKVLRGSDPNACDPRELLETLLAEKIGPYEFHMDQSPLCLVFRETRVDQWPLKFAKSFPRDWHWSMDGSSHSWCRKNWGPDTKTKKQ